MLCDGREGQGKSTKLLMACLRRQMENDTSTTLRNAFLKKRVLIVCGAGIVSGKENIVLQLLKELVSRGHSCYCITSDWGSPDFKKKLKNIGVPFTSIRIGFISKTLSWRAIRMTLHQAL